MIKNTMLAYQNMPLAHFTNGIDIIFASVFIVTGSCNNDNRAQTYKQARRWKKTHDNVMSHAIDVAEK